MSHPQCVPRRAGRLMRAGKVPPELLARLVYPYLGRRPEVLRRAGIGEDCAVLDFGQWAAVVTCDPITTAREHLGRLAVHVACNDLATRDRKSTRLNSSHSQISYAVF